MPTVEGIDWFKRNFGEPLAELTAGTRFDVDMLVAIACQETGSIWGGLRKQPLRVARILELCVGDTLDSRSVFPRSRAELEAWPQGPAMFAIARAALIDMAQHVPGYAAVAARPDKFCHGFGLFQYDIQHFRTDPGYFLNRDYVHLEKTAAKCIEQLDAALGTLGWTAKRRLTEAEKAAVAICYNSGGYDPARGLRQGHRDSGGRYYGENFHAYLQLAKTVPAPPRSVRYIVETGGGTLNLRRAPRIGNNVRARLPDRLAVRVTGAAADGFLPIRAPVGALQLDGWASAQYLRRASGPAG